MEKASSGKEIDGQQPRICMPIFSAFAKHAFRTGLREAQDVLADCDDVEFIHLEPSSGFTHKEQWLMKLVYHDMTGKIVSFNPGLKPVQLKREYELFVLVCPWWRDVWYANAIRGWKDQCRTSVCWIGELWAKSIPNLEHWLPVLKQFDYIIVGIEGSGTALGDAIGRPCHELDGGVDAIRFSPYPNPPERVVDVLSIGRRQEEIHKAILDFAAHRRMFYVHDTLQSGDSQAPAHREHRNMYASLAKRSRFFMVAPGKVNVPEHTRGQVALAFRYFEGSAAGAIMIGQAPDCESFNTLFDWPDAVVEIQPDGSDVVDVISSLSAQPERIAEISRRNAREALLRHDWVYRWKRILDIAGFQPAPEMAMREKRLTQLADQIRRGE